MRPSADRLAHVVPGTAPFTTLSGPSFRQDWSSNADRVYDVLDPRPSLPMPWGFALGCAALWCWAVWRALRGER